MFEAPYEIEGIELIPSPSLLVFRSIVESNVDAMMRIAGDVGRLRPHAKTHKMAAMIRLLAERGIEKHKCATLAEAEMIARAGGRDVLLAYPLVGLNPARFARLVSTYPQATFRATVDTSDGALELAAALAAARIDRPVPTLIDLNVGMGRTGVTPLKAVPVATTIRRLPQLVFDGLHVYDGHVREPDPALRSELASGVQDEALSARYVLQDLGFEVPRIVLGGTPAFPMHARCEQSGIELSPGTCCFHDHGYASRYPDLPFVPAALVLTRVVSRPGHRTICLDVGSKAVATDPAGDRVRLLGLPDSRLGPQSEEHLVVETAAARSLPPGTPVLAIPTHICPTVALHAQALVIEAGRLGSRWEVTARGRAMSFEEF